ncbi:MAG TPA: nucleoside-triphosphatase [Bacteroidales bacterium]|nr:nucleoside-triphosphatase [Bacteroidales bacterium]
METIVHRPLNSIWLKASVIGSFWASVEIILGSFLHNLKVPLSGTVLSFISVYLMVAFLQVWKEKGLVIRAGLICALMKSISPSALIIGPMIGIFSEALLLEIFILLLGRNLVSYITGGAFAVLSAILHKFASLLVMYGFDFVKILNALYQFTVKQIHLPGIDPLNLIVIIVIIYMATGALASVSGYITGKKYMSGRAKHIISSSINIEYDTKKPFETQSHGYSVIYLISNIAVLVISLLIINSGQYIFTWIIPPAYIIFCIIHYRSSLKRFRKLSLWIQFILITAVAAFLWNSISGEGFFSMTGLVAGLRMIGRAIVVIIGFAAISIELKNPVIKSVLYGRGFASLYQSLNLSFSALGSIISSLPESRNFFKQTRSLIPRILKQAEYLLDIFEKEDSNRSSVLIITGDIRQGKTTFLGKVIEILRQENIKFSGFLSSGIDRNGERMGFELFDLKNSVSTELCTRIPSREWLHYGSFYFNPEGLKRGYEILDPANLGDTDIVVIDEIGPLELNNKGWNRPVEVICNNMKIFQIWVVRRAVIKQVMR